MLLQMSSLIDKHTRKCVYRTHTTHASVLFILFYYLVFYLPTVMQYVPGSVLFCKFRRSSGKNIYTRLKLCSTTNYAKDIF